MLSPFFRWKMLTLFLRLGKWLPPSCGPSIAVQQVRRLLRALSCRKSETFCHVDPFSEGQFEVSPISNLNCLFLLWVFKDYLLTVVFLMLVFSDVFKLLVFWSTASPRCKRREASRQLFRSSLYNSCQTRSLIILNLYFFERNNNSTVCSSRPDC